MSGDIFISYRREEASAWARLVKTGLFQHFPKSEIFMDVDTIEPGMDFVAAIEESVGSCEVLIAVIGKRWLDSSDEEGKRRLDNPEDSVRLEIATALKRNVRVIPVLVDGALMPRSSDLPDDLKALVRRNAVEVSHSRFNADLGRLIAALEKVLEKANAERKHPEETPTTEREAEAALTRGLASYYRRDYDKAISAYNEAIRLNPNNAKAYNGRGTVYGEVKEYDKANSDFGKAIRLDPHLANAYYNRGLVFYLREEYDNSIGDYTEAIRLMPDYFDAYLNRGSAYDAKKEYDKAIADYTEAIRLRPNEPSGHTNRGLTYENQGNLDKAKADLAKAKELKSLFNILN